MTRDEWRSQMMVLTHEETDAEHYNAAFHTIEAWDVAQRMKISHLEAENAQLRADLAQATQREARLREIIGQVLEVAEHSGSYQMIITGLKQALEEAGT